MPILKKETYRVSWFKSVPVISFSVAAQEKSHDTKKLNYGDLTDGLRKKLLVNNSFNNAALSRVSLHKELSSTCSWCAIPNYSGVILAVIFFIAK